MINVCVYGSLKKGFHNHPFLKNAKFLGKFITEPIYTMYNLGGYPTVTEGGTTAIHCEVYEVTTEEEIRRLNFLEGFTGIKNHPKNMYERQTIETSYGDAEMYYFTKNPNTLIIKSGIWTY